MQKKILIAIGIVVIAAGIAFGVYRFLIIANSDSNTAYNHSKDYGACNMIDTATIKTTLGDVATNLQKPVNMGIVSNKAVGENVSDLISDSQSCVYAFAPGGTIENGQNANNAFVIERIIYINTSGPKTLIAQIKSDSLAEPIDSLPDTAFYASNTASQGPGAIHTFQIETFTAKTSVRYSIRQPVASDTLLTNEAAKTALVTLVKAPKSQD